MSHCGNEAPHDVSTTPSLPQVYNYHPATFAERGLAAPFTSPILAGARLRLAKDVAKMSADFRAAGGSLEVIVPTWAGGRGVYVVPWPDVRQLFRPTVHDIRVGESLVVSLRFNDCLRPSELRRIGREVARDGFAGRTAAAAAADALEHVDMRAEAAFEDLLQALVLQLCLDLPPDALTPAVVSAAARALGKTAQELAVVLRDFAGYFAEIGIGPQAATSPIRKIIAATAQLGQDVTGWAGGDAAAANGAALHLVASAQTMTMLTERLLTPVRKRLSALPALCRDAFADRAAVMQELERGEWAVDGWERICLLWRSAAASLGRASVLPEMASLVPQLPDELDRWVGLPPGTAAKLSARNKMMRAIAEPSFHTLDVIARNERLRSFAA